MGKRGKISVPQGTKLGPWLFILIMIDDINTGNTKLWKYVDDPTIAECFDKKVTCDQAILFFLAGETNTPDTIVCQFVCI